MLAPATWSRCSVWVGWVSSVCGEDASKLGAHYYINNQTQDTAAELRKLGGAKVILATALSGEAMSAAMGGLALKGTLMVIGLGGPLRVSPGQIIQGSRSERGW
jgi:alcohol dehydrogenase/propanol-preferring alcohol dehydrogenase